MFAGLNRIYCVCTLFILVLYLDIHVVCSKRKCSYLKGDSPGKMSIVAENVVGNSEEGQCSTSMTIYTTLDVATAVCYIIFLAVCSIIIM